MYVSQIRCERAVQSQVVHVLRPAKYLEKLREVGGPTANRLRECAQHRGRAFAPPPHDGVANVEPVTLADRIRKQIRTRECGEVRDGPVFTSLDEEVVPK